MICSPVGMFRKSKPPLLSVITWKDVPVKETDTPLMGSTEEPSTTIPLTLLND
jgi:hypothetical protein